MTNVSMNGACISLYFFFYFLLNFANFVVGTGREHQVVRPTQVKTQYTLYSTENLCFITLVVDVRLIVVVVAAAVFIVFAFCVSMH